MGAGYVCLLALAMQQDQTAIVCVQCHILHCCLLDLHQHYTLNQVLNIVCAGHYYNRARVMAVACLMWSLFTGLFAFSTNVHQGMALWAFNGLGLAWMIPNGQSMMADMYDATHRGRAFGVLGCVGKWLLLRSFQHCLQQDC